MKFKKIIKKSLAVALVFGTTFSVVGCKSDESRKNKSELPELIDKNIEEEEEIVVTDNDGVNGYVDRTTFLEDHGTIVIDSSCVENGVLVVKNEYDRVGFYSLFYQKYLIAPQFTREWLKYSIIKDDNLGHIIQLEYKNKNYMYDSLGNALYESENSIRLFNNSTREVNDEVYVVIEEYSLESGRYKIVSRRKYKADGTLEFVSSVPDSVYNEEIEIEEDATLDFGDIFVSQDKIDLEEYGLKGKYILKSNNMHTVFNSNNNSKVATFVIPTDNYTIIGSEIFYQISQEIGVDSEDYTYALGETKMLVKTYVVDMLTGKTEEIKTIGLYNSLKSYKDKKEKYTYGLANFYEIENKSLVSIPKSVIIDSRGNVVEEVTGYEIEDFIKIGNNYYNETTKIIYNSQMKEITYLGYISPVHYKQHEMFIGIENGKWGAVGYDGKIVIPFVYDSLNPLEYVAEIDVKDDCLIVRRGAEYFAFNKSTGVEISLGNQADRLYEDLYLVVDDKNNEFKFISQSEKYATYKGIVDFSSIVVDEIALHEMFGKYVISTMLVKETENHNYTSSCFTHVVKKLPNASTFTTIGEEVKEKEEIGNNFSNAIDLSLGENKVHLYGEYGGTSYLEFTPSKTAKYIFDFKDNYLLSGDVKVLDDAQKEIYVISSTDSDRDAFAVELEEGRKYYVVGTYGPKYYKYSTVVVKENTGEYFDHPLIFNKPYGEMQLDFEQGINTVFVEFTPIASTDYTIKGQTLNIATHVVNKNDTSGLTSNLVVSYLEEDVPVKIRIEKTENTQSPTLTIEPLNKENDGSTILNSIQMSGDAGIITTEDEGSKFYSYSSTQKSLKKITFTNTLGTPVIAIYNSRYEAIKGLLLSEEVTSTYYDFDAGEKVYIEIIGESDISVNLIDVNVNKMDEETSEYASSELSIYNKKEFYEFVAPSTSVYWFNAGNTDLLDPDVELALYDGNMNLVSTYMATQNGFQLVTDKPLEKGKKYFIEASSDKVDDTTSFNYALNYGAISLYEFINNYNEGLNMDKDGTITFTKSDMTYEERVSVRFYIQTKGLPISVSFDYDLNGFVSQYSGNYGYFIAYRNSYDVINVSGYYGGRGSYSTTFDDVEGQNLEFYIYKDAYIRPYNRSEPILTISNLIIRLL